jgi:hypothetical protein
MEPFERQILSLLRKGEWKGRWVPVVIGVDVIVSQAIEF